MVYLLKVTIALTLFLFLFEVLYKNNGRFAVNRVYLLAAVMMALIFPLVSLPSNVPDMIATTQMFNPVVASTVPDIKLHAAPVAASRVAAAGGMDIWQLLYVAYSIGVALLLLKIILELGQLLNLMRRPFNNVNGHKVIVTGRQHTPYSFMGRIFISDMDMYNSSELAYIIAHEAAHNDKKHWIDLLILQIACIALWFHPLIWRYRYLLRLQHEYEADAVVAYKDTYGYGHFLLQQTMLKHAPSIAHTFHFSPIKNRVKMLTKRNKQKTGAWKYFLVIPVLLGCTFLMAKDATKTSNADMGNITNYKGNTFKWRGSDTLVYDKSKRAAILMPMDTKFPYAQIRQKRQVAYEMNGEPVYENEYLKTPAQYGSVDRAYETYLQTEFSAANKHTPDSLTIVIPSNIVIDKNGRVMHYDLQYLEALLDKEGKVMYYDRKKNISYYQPLRQQNPLLDRERNSVVEKIIKDGPAWQPAMVDGKQVNSFINTRQSGC